MVSLQSIEGCTVRPLGSCHSAGSNPHPAASNSPAATTLQMNAQILRARNRNAGRAGGTPGATPAQLVTTLYNPNNIVEDVAPITVQLELEVGRQLARMLGFAVDGAHEPATR